MADQNYQYPSQEVFALRKQGEHEKALALSREIFHKDPNNDWNVRALAWSLYDEIKLLKEGKDSEALDGIKQELVALKLPSDDTMLEEGVARAMGTDAAGRAAELSKAGNHREAVQLIRPIARAKEASQHAVEAYGWILYRKIRDCGEDEQDVPIWCLNEFLNSWSSGLKPNQMLFSNIFIQAKRQAENWTGLIALIEKLGLYQLKPEDFADEDPDSDFSPFQDQLLGAVHKCLKKHSSMRETQPVIHQWLEAWKDSFGNDEWPQYHLGHILLWTGGDLDQAKLLLLKTVQRNPGDFWRWQAFAEVLQGNEAKAALSRGILCSCDDGSFKVTLYKEYAELLAAEGEIPAAMASLKEAMRLRKLSGNDWREPIPTWFDPSTEDGSVDIHRYAEPFATTADKLLAASLPSRLCALIRPLQKEGRFLFLCPGAGTRTLKFRDGQSPPAEICAIEAQFEDKEGGVCMVLGWKKAEVQSDLGVSEIGVVGHVNTEKQLASVATPTEEFIPLYFNRWQDASELKAGMFVELQYLTQPEHKPIVLKWTPVAPKHIPDFTIPVQGVFVQARDRAHGFIEMGGSRVFVHPDEAKNFQDSSRASGWAIRSTDKHGRASWKLLPTEL